MSVHSRPRGLRVYGAVLAWILVAGCISEDRQEVFDTTRAGDTVILDAGGDADGGDTAPGDVSDTDPGIDTAPPCPGVDCEPLGPCQRAVLIEETCVCERGDLEDFSFCTDGNACTVDDHCLDGACLGAAVAASVLCDDQNPCTMDLCDDDTGCQYIPLANVACDDGDPCWSGERCVQGACAVGDVYECAPCSIGEGDGCNDTYGTPGSCDGALVCVDGQCRLDPATINPCPDQPDPCTSMLCRPTTGQCARTSAEDGVSCTDGSACTTGDACHEGACLGVAVSVDTGVCGCAGDDDCAHLDDGDLCNGTMRCFEMVCVFDFASPVTCDPAISVCEETACVPSTGECQTTKLVDDTVCDDGDSCTSTSACRAGVCRGDAGCERLDGPCERGICAPDGSGCLKEPLADGMVCDLGDGALCDWQGACDAGACVKGPDNPCDDGDACTINICEPQSGCASSPVIDSGRAEVCDEIDNDCDGLTDNDCLESGACAVGELTRAWAGGDVQACGLVGGVPYGLAGCGAGFHLCTASQLNGAIGPDDPGPPGNYWLSAAIVADGNGTIAAQDQLEANCVEFDGACPGAHTVHAITSNLSRDGLGFVTEAWGCDGSGGSGSCAEAAMDGVLCCADTCDSDAYCDDSDPCTEDRCWTQVGQCTNTERPRPDCTTLGVCAGATLVCTADGAWECGFDALPDYEAVEATCDGLDNDCDGFVDGQDPDFAPAAWPPCELDIGVCEGAVKAANHCVDGQWLPCELGDYLAHDSAFEAGAETRCDGKDNDCSGSTDETFAYGGASVGASCDGVGACGEGVVVCAPRGDAATCSTDVDGTTPQVTAERCDGLDNDCDGGIDEDLDPAAAECPTVGVCGASTVPATCEGVELWRCDLAAVEGYSAAEICDGADNNCDGATDEGFVYVIGGGQPDAHKGDSCGDGACDGGIVVCNSAGDGLICSSDEVGSGERCDGVDNDCNGATDEGLIYTDPVLGDRVLSETCSGLGACGVGTVVCGGEGAITCSTLPNGADSEASAELCDGIDNDCDGETDDAIWWQGVALGEACDAPGACGVAGGGVLGTVECADDGAARCSTGAGGSQDSSTTEICDGIDNDCDGETDEGAIVGPGDCDFAGVCTIQVVNATCRGDQGWECDFSAGPHYSAAGEVGLCDGRDNDCDGDTDEDYEQLGAACDGPDPDSCLGGIYACDASGAGVKCQGDVNVVEVCSGGQAPMDEDCDGVTDEEGAKGCIAYYNDVDGDGWGSGEARCLCAPDVTAGFNAVNDGDCLDGDTTVHPKADEVCDGVDNDCDSATDAADAGLVRPPCEKQDGVCQGLLKTPALCAGQGGWLSCSDVFYDERLDGYEPVEASCDGLDNDCDGLRDGEDADVESERVLCAKQAGVCVGVKAPRDYCTAEGWAECDVAVYGGWSQAYEHGDEVSCDGADNDCDGAVDDPFGYGDGGVGDTCDGVGACGIGTVRCHDDGDRAVCSTNPDGDGSQAQVETCNGADDDCDGQTDEGLSVLDSDCRLLGVCHPDNVAAACASGAWLCDYSGVDGYQPGSELTCDGADNDCDGLVDEDFDYVDPGSGEAVPVGGDCGSEACAGVVVCAGDGQAAVCSSEGGDNEVCDGLDNDCDGETDEGLVYVNPQGGVSALGEPCIGLGECGAGNAECSDALGVTCSSNPDGSESDAEAEVCDGDDNDCDGLVDEGFAWGGQGLGETCAGLGECGVGVVRCRIDGSAATCSTQPDGGAPDDALELCDGLDNDCDGATDDGLGVVDSDCLLAGVCTPNNVLASCGGVGGWTCDYSQVPGFDPAGEVMRCDDLDNDCDGLTDEDSPTKGQPCDGQDVGLCEEGTWVCAVDGGVRCNDFTGDDLETCGDDFDNDCDGFTDEAGANGCTVYHYDGDQDTYGVFSDSMCLCEIEPAPGYTAIKTQFDCLDTNATVHPGAVEVCDGVDNDCDGLTDEPGAVGCDIWFYDWDGDAWGVNANQCQCGPDAESGFRASQAGDCDDYDDAVNPDAVEICNGVDDNCDGDADLGQDLDGCADYYLDVDGDGYGVSEQRCLCMPADGYDVDNTDDCCDEDNRVYPDHDDYYSTKNLCGDFDFNCDETVEARWTGRGDCKWTTDGCELIAGWLPTSTGTNTGTGTGTGTGGGGGFNPIDQIPRCGISTKYITSCDYGATECSPIVQSRTQECR